MNGTGGSVAYFIMDGGIKVTVQGKQVKLRELARAGLKTRTNGYWAKIARAEYTWFLLRQSGRAQELGFGEDDQLRFYERLARGDTFTFPSVASLVLYKRTRVLGNKRNEAGFFLNLVEARAARFVRDLTRDWGKEYVLDKDTRGHALSDGSLVVLSGPFKHIVRKDSSPLPSITPSNSHCCGGPYFCTKEDVRDSLLQLTLSEMPCSEPTKPAKRKSPATKAVALKRKPRPAKKSAAKKPAKKK